MGCLDLWSGMVTLKFTRHTETEMLFHHLIGQQGCWVVNTS